MIENHCACLTPHLVVLADLKPRSIEIPSESSCCRRAKRVSAVGRSARDRGRKWRHVQFQRALRRAGVSRLPKGFSVIVELGRSRYLRTRIRPHNRSN